MDSQKLFFVFVNVLTLLEVGRTHMHSYSVQNSYGFNCVTINGETKCQEGPLQESMFPNIMSSFNKMGTSDMQNMFSKFFQGFPSMHHRMNDIFGFGFSGEDEGGFMFGGFPDFKNFWNFFPFGYGSDGTLASKRKRSNAVPSKNKLKPRRRKAISAEDLHEKE